MPVRTLAQSGEPTSTDWSGASDCYSSTAFYNTGGLVGFAAGAGVGSVDEFKVRSWNTNTSDFDVVEHYDQFTIDGSGYGSDTLTYDLAGNLTFDGSQKYTYDGWQRMRTVAHAYRDGSGALQSGQTFSTTSYDGKGRRVKKAISGTGSWDCTYTYLYDHDSTIETRNGSGTPVQQYVWGTRYVDELVQVASESDNSSDGVDGDTALWALQDANYNVLGLVDSSGVLVERYQYTPYGQRQVYYDAGSNDVGAHAVTLGSRRIISMSDGLPTPYGYCEAGHQGLLHDEESGLVYNRARMLSPGLGRFAQRDVLSYQDYMSLLTYERGNPIKRVDSSGLLSCVCGEKASCVANMVFLHHVNAPWYCLRGGQLAEESQQAADATGYPGRHNGVRDAWRHCYWSCRMSQELGPEEASLITTLHEDCTPQNPANERAMDEANNLTGIVLGMRQPPVSCHDACTDKVNEGGLTYLPEGTWTED